MATPVNLHISTRCTFGPVVITCKDGAGQPVPLAGWSAFAEIRRPTSKRGDLTTYGEVILDLAPTIAADDTTGTITIPAVAHAVTAELVPTIAEWDLIIEDADGNRLPPILAGRVTIGDTVTQKS